MRIPALSIRQPWAGLIVQGIKSLEVRTWDTHHRGPLCIVSSQALDNRPHVQQHHHEEMYRGVTVGFVNLTKIGIGKPHHKDAALVDPTDQYIWHLEDPFATVRMEVSGKLGLYQLTPKPVLARQWARYVKRVDSARR